MIERQRANFVAGHAFRKEVERHIADHFAGRCDLDDVTEQLIDVGVHLLDLLPPLP